MNSYNCDGLLECWYLYYYFKYKTHDDYLSFKLMDFKGDKKPQIEIFAKLAVSAFENSKLEFDYVVRALSSNESTPNAGKRIIPVAKAIATASNALYKPNILYKTRETKQLKGMSKAMREQELMDVYRSRNGYELNGKKVLIVDDIATSGVTMSAIAKAITDNYPEALLYGFTLAHTQDFGFPALNKNKTEWEDEYKALR